MTVRRTLLIAVALVTALLVAGCSDHNGPQLTAETDDPYYVQGIQLMRQGRNTEALTSFLKVIERRGEKASAESHLQAGQIYLNHIKEPVFAYYHFRKYLELQPNSSQTELVRGMVAASLREFAKSVPGGALGDPSVRVKADAEVSKLQQENAELRAELAVLRGSATMPVNRPARMINVPVTAPTSAPAGAGSIAPATPITAPPITAAPALNPPVTVVAQRSSPPAPVTRAAAPAVSAPRPVAPPRGATTTPARTAASGRMHTVAPKETLFSIAKRYGVKMEDLVALNGLPSVNAPLRIGTVLKIPATAPGR